MMLKAVEYSNMIHIIGSLGGSNKWGPCFGSVTWLVNWASLSSIIIIRINVRALVKDNECFCTKRAHSFFPLTWLLVCGHVYMCAHYAFGTALLFSTCFSKYYMTVSTALSVIYRCYVAIAGRCGEVVSHVEVICVTSTCCCFCNRHL